VKALVITRAGGPEVLSVVDRPRPEPQGDEILVRVAAAGVNRADIMQREGHYPAPPDSPQDIPGLEYSGVVEALGPDARARKVGQRVFGLVGGGAQAEYLVTREGLSMLVPDPVTEIDAGAIPEAYITAHDALYTQGALAHGERVLVHAVGSGVGIAILQFSKARACTVYGTSRTPDKLEKAKALGLDVAIDATATPFDEIARDIDVVIDFIGAPYLEQNLKTLRTRGRLIVVSTLGGANATLSLRMLMSKRLRINGTMLRARTYEEKVEATRAFERDAVPLLANEAVHVPVDKTFPLEQAAYAHELIAANANFGKLVFTIG